MTERLRQTRLRPKAHQTHHLTSGKTLQAAHTSRVRPSVPQSVHLPQLCLLLLFLFVAAAVASHAVIMQYNVPQMLADYKTMRQRQFQFSTFVRCATGAGTGTGRQAQCKFRGSSARSLPRPHPRLLLLQPLPCHPATLPRPSHHLTPSFALRVWRVVTFEQMNSWIERIFVVLSCQKPRTENPNAEYKMGNGKAQMPANRAPTKQTELSPRQVSPN